jgi:hypothetical protein
MTNQLTDAPSNDALLALEADELMEEGEELEMGDVIQRPDGYYWVAVNGTQEFGPFKTLELALADMQLASEETSEPGETLQEAEDELGLADWIDPDTGELAEGQSTPRLHDE